MATRTAALAVEVESDVARAVSGLDDVGGASRDAGTDVAKMGRDAEASARRLSITADSADELGGKAGKATGALGALSAGFELVGMEKYATGLQSAAMATDFMSGVGDSLNLVMESTIVKNIRARAATVGHAIATKATAVATGVMTGAQWALNAAMNANPIALIVLGIIAVAAGMTLAYKKSETVRTILNAVGRAGRQALGWIVDKARDLVGWVRDKIPSGFNAAKNGAVNALRLITTPQRALLNLVKDVVTWVKDKIPAAFDTAKTKAKAIGDTLLAPFRAVRDMIQSIIDKIKSIKLPKIDLPNIPGLRLSTAGIDFGRTSSAPLLVGGSDTVNIYVSGVVGDTDSVVRAVTSAMDARARRFGRRR